MEKTKEPRTPEELMIAANPFDRAGETMSRKKQHDAFNAGWKAALAHVLTIVEEKTKDISNGESPPD
tara:strand:- start:318 stop:518 length:201 start_codon:yes stop_codon:yes gene_type:complete